MAERGVDIVAISGGDGTVHAVLDTVLGASPFPRLPLLAVLRGGTANMTARDIGMRGPQDRALAALIQCVARGGDGLAVTGRTVMRIDPGAGRAPLHGMFFGAAAISQGIEYCKRNVHTLGLRGEIGPAVTMARFVVAMARGERAIMSPVPITVAVDGGPRDRFRMRNRASHDAAASWCWGCGRIGAPRPRRSTMPACAQAPKHWIKALPGLLTGRPNRYVTPANGYESHNAHRIDMGLDSSFFVDGEIFSPTPGVPLTLTAGGTVECVTLR